MSMKKKWSLIAAIFALVVSVPLMIAASVDLLIPEPVQAMNGQVLQANTIQVVGQGEIKVQPDVAFITLSVETEGKTAEAAQAANAKQFATLEKLLYETYKLDKKDVRTSGFYVRPEYHRDEGKAEIVGYIATHTVTITYREMDNIGALIDDAAKAGANRVDGVQFGTEKYEEYQLQAMEKALENAKAKAQALAGYAGKTLGIVMAISETGTSGPPIILGETAQMMDLASAKSTSIQIGELNIKTSLQVTYSFQ